MTFVQHDRYELVGANDRPVHAFSLPHQSDFLRLDILIREGGIYLDSDTYALKSFTELLSSPRDALLGHEGGNRYGLCNAVVIARPASDFIVRWQATYESFRDEDWNKHSVRIPKQLAVQYPETICSLSPTVFFWPTWAQKHIHYMHEPLSTNEANEFQTMMSSNDGSMYENQLAYHAWGSRALEYLPTLTPDDILSKDTRFNILIRDIYSAPI